MMVSVEKHHRDMSSDSEMIAENKPDDLGIQNTLKERVIKEVMVMWNLFLKPPREQLFIIF